MIPVSGHVAKRQPQTAEQHHDDCGEDVFPLGEDFLANKYSEDDALDGIYEEYLIILTSWDLGYKGRLYLPDTIT